MTIENFLTVTFGTLALLAAIYVALSRDLLRVTVAFFVQLTCLSGVLLSLNADYLALLVFAIGLLGTVLVIAFSSVIMGSLKESLKSEYSNTTQGGVLTRVWGILLGLGLGSTIGWAILNAPFLSEYKQREKPTEPDVLVLGNMLHGEHVVVLQILAILILLVILGIGLLMRDPKDAN